ncbi:MAG: hypothetical protein P8X82_12245 [Gemmatimonadales bacterium]
MPRSGIEKERAGRLRLPAPFLSLTGFPYGFLRLVGLEAVELDFDPELLDTDPVDLGAAGRLTRVGVRVGVDGRLTVAVVRVRGADVTRRGVEVDGLLVVDRILVDEGLLIVVDRVTDGVVARRVDVTCRRTSVARTGLT